MLLNRGRHTYKSKSHFFFLLVDCQTFILMENFIHLQTDQIHLKMSALTLHLIPSLISLLRSCWIGVFFFFFLNKNQNLDSKKILFTVTEKAFFCLLCLTFIRIRKHAINTDAPAKKKQAQKSHVKTENERLWIGQRKGNHFLNLLARFWSTHLLE